MLEIRFFDSSRFQDFVALLTFLLNLLNLCELFSDFSKFCVTLWKMGWLCSDEKLFL